MIINFAAYSIADEAIALSEMESIFMSLRSQGSAGRFIGGLLAQVISMKGEEWVAKKWNQSGLQLNSLINAEREDIDKIIKEHVRIFSILYVCVCVRVCINVKSYILKSFFNPKILLKKSRLSWYKI